MRFVSQTLLCAAAISALAFVAGCGGGELNAPAAAAAPAPVGSVVQNGQHTECTVCKANADLACVDVVVDDQTPRYESNGKTYYFCSNSCRDEFARNPGKFLPK